MEDNRNSREANSELSEIASQVSSDVNSSPQSAQRKRRVSELVNFLKAADLEHFTDKFKSLSLAEVLSKQESDLSALLGVTLAEAVEIKKQLHNVKSQHNWVKSLVEQAE